MAIENALLFSKHTQAQLALQKAHDELESRVRERTADLLKANDQLKNEIAERKQAEEKLKNTTEQLKEANKSLERAYAQMKGAKDRISAQLYGEEIVFSRMKTGESGALTKKGLRWPGKAESNSSGRIS